MCVVGVDWCCCLCLFCLCLFDADCVSIVGFDVGVVLFSFMFSFPFRVVMRLLCYVMFGLCVSLYVFVVYVVSDVSFL